MFEGMDMRAKLPPLLILVKRHLLVAGSAVKWLLVAAGAVVVTEAAVLYRPVTFTSPSGSRAGIVRWHPRFV